MNEENAQQESQCGCEARPIGEKLAECLNHQNREGPSNTPDFILGVFLEACLVAFERATRERERWYGFRHSIGSLQRETSSGRVYHIPMAEFDAWLECRVPRRDPVLEPLPKDPEPPKPLPPGMSPDYLRELRSQLKTLKTENDIRDARILDAFLRLERLEKLSRR